MSSLEIRNIEKSFGDVAVLKGIDLNVVSGEFFTLLGPSGCGKTTLLRIIAGFQRQDAGRIVVDGDRIDERPAHKRDIGMVFQDYAVFPHLTVAENIAFGLRARRMPPADIAATESTRASGWCASKGSRSACRPNSPAASSSVSALPAPWRSGRSCC